MKRSVYRAARVAEHRRRFADSSPDPEVVEHWAILKTENDVDAAEAAGVVWDPEEEPLPERVTVRTYPGGVVGDLREAGGGPMSTETRTRMLDEAARRYNAWPELEKLVKRLEVWASGTVWPAEERRYMEAAVRALREFLAERKAR